MLENGKQNHSPDELLEFYTEATENSSSCAILTPSIRAKLREMQSGQVLEVRVNDRAARSDIESWCRLSGNTLLDVLSVGESELRLFIEKK